MSQSIRVKLPKPGGRISVDRRTGMIEILDMIIAGEITVVAITIQCVAGGLMGQIKDPVVKRTDYGYTVSGENNLKGYNKFKFYDDPKVTVEGRECLTTISSIYVDF